MSKDVLAHSNLHVFSVDKITEVLSSNVHVFKRHRSPLELILFEWNLVIGPGLSPPKSRDYACTECLRPTSPNNRCSKCGLVVCPQHDGSQKHEESAECSVLSKADSEADAAWKAENVDSLILAVMPIR